MRSSHRHNRTLQLGILVLGAAMLVTSPSRGQERFWINPGGGSFDNPQNWLDGLIPGASGEARFHLGGHYYVAFPQPVSNSNLQIFNGSVTFGIGTTYTITSTAVHNQFATQIGYGGTLNLASGHLISNTLHAGAENTGHGTLVVSGGAKLSSTLLVGYLPGSSGLAVFRSGAQFNARGTYPASAWSGWVNVGGYFNSVGELIVEDPGTLFVADQSVQIGGLSFFLPNTASIGVATVRNGARLETGTLTVGQHDNIGEGHFLAEGAGTTVDADHVTVGRARDASLMIRDAALLTASGIVIGDGPTGDEATMTITGLNSTATAATMVVGGAGPGAIAILEGGRLVAGSLTVGTGPGDAALHIGSSGVGLVLDNAEFGNSAGIALHNGALLEIEGTSLLTRTQSSITVHDSILSVGPDDGEGGCGSCMLLTAAGSWSAAGEIQADALVTRGTVSVPGQQILTLKMPLVDQQMGSFIVGEGGTVGADEVVNWKGAGWLRLNAGATINAPGAHLRTTGGVHIETGATLHVRGVRQDGGMPIRLAPSSRLLATGVRGEDSSFTHLIFDVESASSFGAIRSEGSVGMHQRSARIEVQASANLQRGDRIDLIRAGRFQSPLGTRLELDVQGLCCGLAGKPQWSWWSSDRLSIIMTHPMDVNLDGRVSASDAAFALYWLGTTENDWEWNKADLSGTVVRNADVNGDGIIDMTDVRLIMQHIGQ